MESKWELVDVWEFLVDIRVLGGLVGSYSRKGHLEWEIWAQNGAYMEVMEFRWTFGNLGVGLQF